MMSKVILTFCGVVIGVVIGWFAHATFELRTRYALSSDLQQIARLHASTVDVVLQHSVSEKGTNQLPLDFKARCIGLGYLSRATLVALDARKFRLRRLRTLPENESIRTILLESMDSFSESFRLSMEMYEQLEKDEDADVMELQWRAADARARANAQMRSILNAFRSAPERAAYLQIMEDRTTSETIDWTLPNQRRQQAEEPKSQGASQ